MEGETVYGAAVLRSLRELSGEDRAVALIRHSVRSQSDTSENAPLTEEGHEAAEAFGTSLPPVAELVICHSPILRCEQTAFDIARGYGRQHGSEETRIAGVAPWLTTFHYFAKSQEAMRRHKQEIGGRAFLRAWLDGALPPGIMRPVEEAARSVLHLAMDDVHDAAPGTLRICVGHDFGLLVLRERLFGGRFENLPWNGYLDGIVLVSRSPGKVEARWEDRRTEASL